MNIGSGREVRTSSIKKNEKGVILIEFAFAMIVLIVLFFGVVTVGFYIADHVAIQKVAREGIREATITGSEDAGRDKAIQAAWLWGLNPLNLTIEFTGSSNNGRIVKICLVKYRANIFNKTFPKVIGEKSLTDFDINARASYGWWDFSQ